MTETQLVERWAAMARAIARGKHWRIPGLEREDLEQEALLGLLLAARSYRAELEIPFPRFAQLVIDRRLATAAREAFREKQRPLNESLREVHNELGEPIASVELLPARRTTEQLLDAREQLRDLLDGLEQLSELERRAAIGRLHGYEYAELGVPKQVDNALQRAREKLSRAA